MDSSESKRQFFLSALENRKHLFAIGFFDATDLSFILFRIAGEQATESITMQSEIEAIGREIFARTAGAKPRLFSHSNLTGQLLEWSMQRERLKAQLFRLVDVLPALSSNKEIARHVAEYLGDDSDALPPAMRRVLGLGRKVPLLTGPPTRRVVARMARAFILARDAREAIPYLRAMRDHPTAFTVDLLGETVLSEREAEAYAARYLELIKVLSQAAATWPRVERLDSDDRGPIPTVNVSVKISALFSQIKPEAPQHSIEQLSKRLRPLLRLAKAQHVFINLDMEMYSQKGLTLRLFRSILEEEEFRNYPYAGIAMQAYLRDTPEDLEHLIEWCAERRTRVMVRLVKGAYWDTETIIARQRRWPSPVYQSKEETDAAYERLAHRLLQRSDVIDCAFGTHNVRTIAACIAAGQALRLPSSRLEFQMLYGMAEPIKEALIEMGYRIREYCPLGEMLPGMAYLVRRLLENTSNEGFLRATFSEKVAPEILLRDPSASKSLPSGRRDTEFRNEPHADFSRPELREQMVDALREVRAKLGRVHPLLIGETKMRSKEVLVSRNPARPEEIIGRLAAAGREEAESAVALATTVVPAWRNVPAEKRAQILERTAGLLSRRRFELAALEVFETGKTWSEADADVCEAVDFCRYYGGEIRRLTGGGLSIPGEEIRHEYISRGITAVIAPWNFPLAILCGMTTAALAAGNPVIMKPSGQSAVIAAVFAGILREAGVPAAAINCLPGSGTEVGSALVEHPEVAVIAFTGSREVGLRIWETAGQTRPGQAQLKKVICEMGGKNAIIVDEDADLDEAVPAIVASAFGYQGQKCSALSRLIVLPGIRERLIRRVIEATESLRVGDPADPSVTIGPLIDETAQRHVREVIAAGQREATLAFELPISQAAGWFVGPAIFTNVPPESQLAQEEIFGPVLAIINAEDLDAALRIANGTPYALTGGLFSRSPKHIERVRSEFNVGNLYINRGITGALVARHPFGGFGMSGGGTKAGGPDYLLNFLFPKVIAENVVRRGSVPHQS
jgi:RHH-type proline utilization regulon transcriptional repressor/proline dehydrogenase/delta 1-pyrroline-5-carboxylate dehydrogenase